MNESFYVGGRDVASSDGAHLVVGQMFVRRLGDGTLPPVVLVHGGAQTGGHWEATPDGRPGLAPLLAAHGWPAYIVDLPGVGRSRYHPDHHGPLAHFSSELTEFAFTAPPADAWPTAQLHSQWPGSGRRGDPIFDAFFAGQVGRLRDETITEPAAGAALAALLDQLGPCHVITHSQSGPYGWQLADARPRLVRSLVALEPKGPPWFEPLGPFDGPPERPYGLTATPLTFDPPLEPDQALPFAPSATGRVQQETPVRALANIRHVPVVVVTGEASYHDEYDHLTVQFLRDASVTVQHVRLGEHGIHGNGHMLALELNNNQLAELIHRTLIEHDESARPS